MYFINGEFYEYYGDNDSYDYNNYEKCIIYNETGYNSSSVYDNTYKYYLIHPDELKFNRNIIGEIINIKDDSVQIKNKKLKSEKMNTFFDNLIKYFLISITKTGINKTEIGILIRKLENEFSDKIKNYRDISDILYLIYSIVFNCKDDVIKYLSMIYSFNNDISLFFRNNNKKFNIDKNSDIISLIKISDLIIKNLLKNNIEIDIIKIYENNEKNKSNKKEIVNEKLNNILNKLIDKIKNLIDQNKDLLYSFIIIDFITNFNNLNMILYLNNIDEENKIDFDYFINKFKSLSSVVENSQNIYNRITATLLISKPNNIAKYMINTYYLPINNSTIDGIVKLNTNFYTNEKNTYITENNLKDFIYYDNYNVLSNQISIYHKITKSDLKYVTHLFTKRNLELKYNKKETIDVDKIGYNVKKLYTKKFNEIIHDLQSNRNISYLKNYSEIDTNFEYLYKIFELESN